MNNTIRVLGIGIMLSTIASLQSQHQQEQKIAWQQLSRWGIAGGIIGCSAPVYTDGIRGLLRHGATSTLKAQSMRKVALGAFGLCIAPSIISRITISINKEAL